jgi:two-component system, cell cycle sensor histidine kinase and response regulator CckA
MKPDLLFGLENAEWPALLVDGGGRVLRASGAAVRAFGSPLEGEQPSLSAIWSPENGMTAEEFLSNWTPPPSPALSLKYRAKGGSVISFLTAICSRTDGGDKYFVIQLLPESADHGRSGGQGGDANAIQKQKLDCALQLARSVALDFNNALTSILGYTSLLLSKAEANHPWRKALIEVEKSAEKAAEIANDLAGFSRQEKELPSQRTGNINAILQRCIESFQHSHKDRVAWQVQLERRLLAAKFDEAKVQQAFVRILENAMEALVDKGRVSVQTRNVRLAESTQDRDTRLAAGTYVCAEIADSGVGIEPEVLPRIFEPFFTTKKNPHRGLGLAWVYGIVTNHGGGVAVSSKPGHGTSVRVYLPAEGVVASEGVEFADDLTGNETVLMVDDEDLLLTMGETILSDYGYKVLTANTGHKALEIITKSDKHIDLLITDLVMPVMSGRELVEHVRRVSPTTRVLCSSGYVGAPGQQQGASFLQKPFTSQELLMKVKRLLSAQTAQVD